MKTNFIEQTKRDAENVASAIYERVPETVVAVVCLIIAVVLFAAPWLMD